MIKERMGKFLKKLGPIKLESPVSKNKENEARRPIDCDHIFGDIYISGKHNLIPEKAQFNLS